MKQKKPPERKRSKIVRLLTAPVFYLSEALYKIIPHNRKKSILLLGVCVAFCGVCVSKLDIPYVHHYFTDFLGYAIHGFGLIPIAKIIEPYMED